MCRWQMVVASTLFQLMSLVSEVVRGRAVGDGSSFWCKFEFCLVCSSTFFKTCSRLSLVEHVVIHVKHSLFHGGRHTNNEQECSFCVDHPCPKQGWIVAPSGGGEASVVASTDVHKKTREQSKAKLLSDPN